MEESRKRNSGWRVERHREERGVALVFVALLLFVFFAFAALAIDISHLFVVRNELQNAADAGALAAARFLYIEDGTAVDEGANQIGYDAAVANLSEREPVEVGWTTGNTGDVQRGHWSFATSTFTPNDSLGVPDLWGVTEDDLDADPDFINAVSVVTRREATPATSFFAKVLGHDSFQLSADAVAYIGYAGQLYPGNVDQPLAVCAEAFTQSGEMICSIGRMINSGQDAQTNETGGWTSFEQENPCTGGTNAQEVRDLICGDGNPDTLDLGKDIATTGGMIQNLLADLVNCWIAHNGMTQPWNMTLVVIECPDNNVGPCNKVVGAVNVNVVWISLQTDPQYNKVPRLMGDWSCSNPDGRVCWNDFVNHFNLQNVDGTPAPYADKSIYYMPECTIQDPMGGTGGNNYGILAKMPVLVE